MGTFLCEISNKELNNENKNNYIFDELYIKDKDINNDIRIINSYEERMKSNELEIEEDYKNEDEIKKCQIEINNELIQFNYFHKFKSKGKYLIEYTFNNIITKTCYMFYHCSSLINFDLSNFNTNNVTNMRIMFYYCSSLTNIN